MDYRELGFYQKARQVTLLINSELKTWPKTMQAQEIARQLFRSSTSIGANIAEGHGRHIGPEYIHYLIIAQGSANEVDNWLNTALDCGIGTSVNIKRILALNLETRKMLSGSINSLRSQDAKSIRESPIPYSLNPAPDEDIELGQDKS